MLTIKEKPCCSVSIVNVEQVNAGWVECEKELYIDVPSFVELINKNIRVI